MAEGIDGGIQWDAPRLVRLGTLSEMTHGAGGGLGTPNGKEEEFEDDAQ